MWVWALVIGGLVGAVREIFLPSTSLVGFAYTMALSVVGSVIGAALGLPLGYYVRGGQPDLSGVLSSMLCALLLRFAVRIRL